MYLKIILNMLVARYSGNRGFSSKDHSEYRWPEAKYTAGFSWNIGVTMEQ